MVKCSRLSLLSKLWESRGTLTTHHLFSTLRRTRDSYHTAYGADYEVARRAQAGRQLLARAATASSLPALAAAAPPVRAPAAAGGLPRAPRPAPSPTRPPPIPAAAAERRRKWLAKTRSSVH